MPKISVIIPCYNVENYIGECLDSVINQTFEDIEILMKRTIKEFKRTFSAPNKNIEVVSTDSNGYVNDFNISVPSYSTISVKFYDTLDGDYTKSIFNVEECLSIDN